MSHSYFCTTCGHENTAATVLFNMDPLLTGVSPAKDPFRILHLYFTEKELTDLIASGEDAPDGFKKVTITLPQLMAYFAGKNSMDNETIASLTADELKTFVYGAQEEATAAAKADEDLVDFNFDADDPFADEFPDSAAAADGEETAARVLPAAIRAMLAKSRTNADSAIDEEILKNDLSYIARLFSAGPEASCTFLLKADDLLDDAGQPVIDGYWVGKDLYEEVRLCARCHKPIFRRAGTAPHKVVTFVGETASGKTSTILSLTHYCRYGLHPLANESFDARMWQKDRSAEEDFPTENVFTTLLSDDANLKSDLEWFSCGVAPAETRAVKREDAYHSTFLVENTGDSPAKTILSLMDLPGELFNHGHLDKQRMYDQFPAAFSSSAFVICFDSENVTQEKITNMIDFFSQLQLMRQEFTGEKPWIPCMILLTKCDETAEKVEADSTRIEDLYMLRDEKASLAAGKDAASEAVRSMEKLFSDVPLSNGFYAALRTGAFGHNVVKSDEIRESTAGVFDDVKKTVDRAAKVASFAAEKGLSPEEMRPAPNRIDTLMHWILRTAGCVECFAEYRTKAVVKKVRDYLPGVQYRAENPKNVDQAILRCSLFANPGFWDTKMVRSLNFNEENLVSQFNFLKKYVKDSTADIENRMKAEPESNARE